ncbi:L,D-transpeptidase family protein [Deminuibacter soli]|uniref:Murein L,D-transpeptidase n=1 Tax=Deminuibacter soli TaxID=2291815 RepID=A0A3E1NHI7_9BACT|nr:L,D-transpeptidase family protein [Deminuibacter soli]RFM27248.1 murein L,D-transpeptidase [Deminuibacter soli]
MTNASPRNPGVELFSSMCLCLLLILLQACNNNPKQAAAHTDSLPKQVPKHLDTLVAGSFNFASGIALDSAAIGRFLQGRPAFKEFEQSFYTFYRANHFNYAWYDKNGLIETANVLVSGIMDSEADGVNPTIPYKNDFLQLLQYNDSTIAASPNRPDTATELMLTGEYFNYAKNIFSGKLNGQAPGMNWFLPRSKLSYAQLLEKNLSDNTIGVKEDNIVSPQYHGLKKALALYRDIDKNGQFNSNIPGIKKTLKPGDIDTVVSLVKQRLFLLGDLPSPDNSKLFDVALGAAAARFKSRHGISPDSTITTAMITALNVPVKQRIEQLMANMERLRWIPADSIEENFILVNIPAYTLHFFEKSKDAWSCNVVVGNTANKTVIFSGRLQYVVLSPYWYVPPGILRKEVLPGIKRNSNYLASHRMEWNGGNVRQKPGPSNSLGLVKFIFPNANNIYLHDSPSKSLFNEDNRAFSHGCIRVAKAHDLALRLLRDDPNWPPDKIEKGMNSGKEQWITLKKKIPVYIGYFTAFMDKDGVLNFRQDVYKRDSRLYSMLAQ